MKPLYVIRWLSLVLLGYFPFKTVSLIIEGELKTIQDWTFIARFCYLSQNGAIAFNFEYPKEACCQELIFYFDDQWPQVYPHQEMTCTQKRSVTIPKNNQIMDLDSVSNRNCSQSLQITNQQLTCYVLGKRNFKASRARWWYIVVSRCGSTQGLSLKFTLEMTNGDNFWTKHFSADETNILQTEIIFFVLSFIVFMLTLLVAFLLRRRQLFHTTYKMFVAVAFFELLSIVINIGYYADYGTTGKPRQGVKNLARGIHCISDLIFVILFILLGKGFTVTRGKISALGQVKLSVFSTLYIITYVALFIYEAKSFDPGRILYLYESPAGIGICILRIIAWVWFCYGVYFTLKNYPQKRIFYFPFWLFYSLWFLSAPVVVLLASYAFDPYMRAQVMNAVDRTLTFMASIFFLVLTRPSQANSNFPYHVRTSQIGIMENSDPNAKDDFDQHMYAPAVDLTENKKFTLLFSVIKSDSVFNGKDNPLASVASKMQITSPHPNSAISIFTHQSMEIPSRVENNHFEQIENNQVLTQTQIFAYDEYPHHHSNQLHPQSSYAPRPLETNTSLANSTMTNPIVSKFPGLNQSFSSNNNTDDLQYKDKYQTSIFQALGAPQVTSNASLTTKSERSADILVDKNVDNVGMLPKQKSDNDVLELEKNLFVDNEDYNLKPSKKIMSRADLATNSNLEEKVSKKLSGTSLPPLKGVLPLGHLPPLTVPPHLNSSTA